MGNYETSGLPYYRGCAARDRVAGQGWSTSFVSEVATGGSSGVGGVNQLWDAPYHRLGMMHPNSVSTGWGYSTVGSRGSTVGDFVYDFGGPPVDLVPSPAHAHGRIPTTRTGPESPHPPPARPPRPPPSPL